MTIHIQLKDIKCSKCSVPFIPFQTNFKCPNCDEATDEFFDFIPEMVDSMKQHKLKYGKFTPDAWYVGSLAEHIQRILFGAFDILEMDKPAKPDEFLNDYLNKTEWGDQQYLQKHVQDIALAVYDVYKSDKELSGEIKMLDPRYKKVSKLKSLWKIWKIMMP